MGDGRGPAPERAQLDALLRWREENVRQAAARRRRWARRGTMASLAVIVVALVAWIAAAGRDTRERVTEQGHAPAESVAAALPEPARPSAPPDDPTPAKPLPAEPQIAPRAEERQEVTAPPTLPARQPSPPRSPVAKARARTSDAAVSVPTASLRTGDEAISPPAWISPTNPGAGDSTAPLPEEPVAGRSTPGAPEARPHPTAEDAPIAARPPSQPETAETPAASTGAPDTKVESGPSRVEAAPPVTGQRQPRSRVIGDKVVGWLEGEVQEVRDTARREIGEFRAGVDKVLSCLAWIRADSSAGCKSPAPRQH